MHMRFRSGAGLMVALLAAAALTAGGIAYASIPDAHGVIHGCYSRNGGTLRVIDADNGETCDIAKGKETPLDWNQTGRQGEKGEPGDPGISGYETVVAGTPVPASGSASVAQ